MSSQTAMGRPEQQDDDQDCQYQSMSSANRRLCIRHGRSSGRPWGRDGAKLNSTVVSRHHALFGRQLKLPRSVGRLPDGHSCLAKVRDSGVATSLTVAAAIGAQPTEHVLRIGMPIVAETLDPARSDNMQANMLMAGIYDTLYVLDRARAPGSHRSPRGRGPSPGLVRFPRIHDPRPPRNPLHATRRFRRQASGTHGGGLCICIPAHLRSEDSLAGTVPARRQDRGDGRARQARGGCRDSDRLRRPGVRPGRG